MSNSNVAKFQQDNPTIKVEKFYVKEISCKLPHAPNLFENPEFKELQITPNIEMNVKTQGVGNNKFEITLHAIINGKAKDISLFNLDVQQSGIFNINISNTTANQLEDMVRNYCVPVLHPYLAQVISNTLVQAGLPPVILQPFQPIIDDAKTNLSQIKGLKSSSEHILESAENIIF